MLPLSVSGRLCSVTVALPGHLPYYIQWLEHFGTTEPLRVNHGARSAIRITGHYECIIGEKISV